MRKPIEDVVARGVMENRVADLLTDQSGVAEKDLDAARAILGEFPSIEFETTSRDVQGETIRLRRPVLTGAWEVDPNGRPAEKK
jgi:hypothetical protein